MAFFASRQPVEAEPSPLPNGDDTGSPPPLPPIVEKALMRVAGTILPQLQPLVVQAEATMAELRQTMKELKAGQELLVVEVARLRDRLNDVQRD